MRRGNPVSPVVDAALGDPGHPERPRLPGWGWNVTPDGEGFVYAKCHRQVLNELLRTDFGRMPSDSTFRQLIDQLDVVAFEALLKGWMTAHPGVADGLDTLVCDGKTLRGSMSETPSGAPTFMESNSSGEGFSYRLDEHAFQTQLAEQLPQHRPLVVLAGGVAGLALADRLLRRRSLLAEKQYATPSAAEYKDTWAKLTQSRRP